MFTRVRFFSFLVFLLLSASFFVQAGDLVRQRTLFLEAEKALNTKQYKTFERLMVKLEGYPLHAWLEYRWLRKTVSLKQADKISEFLLNKPDSRYAAPLKRSWLKYLARKKLWKQYVKDYEGQQNEVYQCHYYWALHQLGENSKALFGARDLWLVGRSQPRACDKLFSWFQKSSFFTNDLIWQRIDLAMGANRSSLAGYLGRFLPAEDQAILKRWQYIHRHPEVLLNCYNWEQLGDWKAKIFVHGILRLARKDPELALSVWNTKRTQFDLNLNKVIPVDNRLALKLAVRKSPLARKQLDRIPDEQTSAAVREWRVRNALGQKAWPEVQSAIARLPEEESNLPKWRYWLARAKEEQGESIDDEYQELAKTRSYYGFMASDHLNRNYSYIDRPVAVDNAELIKLEKLPAFQAVKEFLYFKRRTEARRQWWHAIKGFNQEQLLVASKLAQRWKWEQMAILTIARGEYWDDLSLRFPVSYRPLIERNADKKGLDKALVYGIIRRESAFDKQARSPVGARGLMQIMPSTGKQIARRLKEKWGSAATLYEPEINVHFGTDYFQGLLQQFDGNPVLAMAAYNAGPHRVNRWLPKGGKMDADNWIETIPFKETRQYVSTILAYAVIYQRQLKQTASKMSGYMPVVSPNKEQKKSLINMAKLVKKCH